MEGAPDTNDTPCAHEHTETVGSPMGLVIKLCSDCGRVMLSTFDIGVELFPKVIWRSSCRPDTDKKEGK